MKFYDTLSIHAKFKKLNEMKTAKLRPMDTVVIGSDLSVKWQTLTRSFTINKKIRQHYDVWIDKYGCQYERLQENCIE